MTGHTMTVETSKDGLILYCECGHYAELGELSCNVVRIACLAEAHKAAVLIGHMEKLGVSSHKREE